MRFAHTNIVSLNWKALANFYIETFDCKIVPPIRNQSGKWLERGTGLQNAKLEGAHLLLPSYGENGPTLEIYQYALMENQGPIAPNKKGFGHIAFEVEDVEMVLNTLEKNGGKTIGEITKREVTGVGEITFIYASDPEGNLNELQSWK
ncbi:MAG: catechol 2,3-dioxygenase-like lactoylglutathione lyase family enzyme [Cyclobacteriaceae bacterium]|jgi:catechol 2,3-dioxygenase-like lactoylglutathione lyase family enzyme